MKTKAKISKTKVSRLEEGAVIETTGMLGGKEYKKEEYISEVHEKVVISTLYRRRKSIIETDYLIVKDNGNRFLSDFGSRQIDEGDKDFSMLNKKLTRYEMKNDKTQKN